MPDPKILETFANPAPGRDYLIEHTHHEFTSLCPKTGQPDFAIIRIRYIPRDLCIESKSLKLYLWGFRDRAVFAEALAAEIAGEVMSSARPKRVTVTLTQRPRRQSATHHRPRQNPTRRPSHRLQ